MTEKPLDVQALWSAYVQSRGQTPESVGPPPEAWGFGDSPEMADDLGDLVVQGVKTATCSLLWEYEAEGETLPQEGDLGIVLDGGGNPLCIIETTEVRIVPYDQVDESFAYDEGEGDRSLAYWRDAHWRFFSRVCEALDRSVSPSMSLVCERFHVVYGPS